MPDAALYPDIVEEGGLVPALTNCARRSSIQVTFVGGSDDPGGCWSAVTTAERGSVYVMVGADERAFLVTISNDRLVWAGGHTEKLSDLVRVADCWHRGMTLRQLRQRFPFLSYSHLAEGYEAGNPVAAQWETLLADHDLAHIRPLLLAARANYVLGRLFPAVTHLDFVRFILGDTFKDPQGAWIRFTLDGAYEIGAVSLDAYSRVATIDEAIAEAVARLPESPLPT